MVNGRKYFIEVHFHGNFPFLKKMMYKYIGNYFTVPIIAQAQMPVIKK